LNKELYFLLLIKKEIIFGNFGHFGNFLKQPTYFCHHPNARTPAPYARPVFFSVFPDRLGMTAAATGAVALQWALGESFPQKNRGAQPPR
jgi:hypothetical protein